MVGADIKPVKEPETIGRALTFEERARLFHIATQKPEWETACWAATVAVSTTARGCELRALQWRNVDFISRTLEIPKSKTDAGVRLVPLTEEAYGALLKLRRRAETFGPVEPSHFVFAAFHSKFRFDNRKGGRGGTPELVEVSGFDPSRPMRSWRTAWRTLTRAVECPRCKRLQRPAESCNNPQCKADMRSIKSPLAGLRFHDLRHTSISALGEAGVPDRVIMDIAGHISSRMLRRYSHIQLEAKRTAIQALSNRPQNAHLVGLSEVANVTKHVTKSDEKGEVESLPAQVIESIGRPVGTRTPDLYRVKVALVNGLQALRM
jgi:integrase